jgi:hypothetical protein
MIPPHESIFRVRVIAWRFRFPPIKPNPSRGGDGKPTGLSEAAGLPKG